MTKINDSQVMNSLSRVPRLRTYRIKKACPSNRTESTIITGASQLARPAAALPATPSRASTAAVVQVGAAPASARSALPRLLSFSFMRTLGRVPGERRGVSPTCFPKCTSGLCLDTRQNPVTTSSTRSPSPGSRGAFSVPPSGTVESVPAIPQVGRKRSSASPLFRPLRATGGMLFFHRTSNPLSE